jgi:hypothetical protein
MSAPFKPGDVVVVVYQKDGVHAAPGIPRIPKGSIHRVADVYGCDFWAAVVVNGWPSGHVSPIGNDGWDARSFRKIDDEVTEDFRARLRTLNPPEPASPLPAGHLRAPVEHRARLSSQVRS